MDKNTDVSLEDRWYRFLDEYETALVESNRQLSQLTAKETVFCKEGCANCCCQIFPESSAQVEVIARRLQGSPELMDKYQKQNEKRKQLIADKDEKIREISAIEDTTQFTLEWIALKIPCALLDGTRCMVYDIRPLVCAAYITLSPPRVCAIDPKGYTTPAIHAIKVAFGQTVNELCIKYNVSRELIYDLSWHLDRYLNPETESSEGEE